MLIFYFLVFQYLDKDHLIHYLMAILVLVDILNLMQIIHRLLFLNSIFYYLVNKVVIIYLGSPILVSAIQFQ
jgi:hypothetical protein